MAWNVNGSLVRDVVYETATAPFLANPTGEAVATGHLTLDPFLAPPNDNSNITSAARNGWTNFNAAYLYRQENGDILAPGGYFLWINTAQAFPNAAFITTTGAASVVFIAVG